MAAVGAVGGTAGGTGQMPGPDGPVVLDAAAGAGYQGAGLMTG